MVTLAIEHLNIIGSGLNVILCMMIIQFSFLIECLLLMF